MILWQLGNTTVRSPFRLREALIALQASAIEGRLRGKGGEHAFNALLGNAGIVTFKTGRDADQTYSAGRKWRGALTDLGFLYPKLKGALQEHQETLGVADTITQNGQRLIDAETVAGWQECFLRALASHYIPSVIKPKYECEVFSPLLHALAIMQSLEKKTGESRVSALEVALFVQLSSSEDGVDNIADKIIDFRAHRDASKRKHRYDNAALDACSATYKKKPGTFKDYADLNIRYLKATGLVQSKGKGITFVPSKKVLIKRLISDEQKPKDDLTYLTALCEGARLPTDDKAGAEAVLNDLVGQLKARGEVLNLASRVLDTPADIAVVRYEIEERLFELNEIDYANRQSGSIDEIVEFINLLATKKMSKKLDDGSEIIIPRGEAPAYFEWIIWRAFLAINSLVNKPWDARRFKVDQDFLPVGTAPGGGPDMIFEFDDKVLVVEVTLTTSSRQEAAEGEPVRRHVAKYAEEHAGTGKQVFGLFLAVSIDTNTANTFRLGEWYMKGDNKIDVHIVPIPLIDFYNMLVAVKDDAEKMLPKLFEFLVNCRMHAIKDAPEWKAKISELSTSTVEALSLK